MRDATLRYLAAGTLKWLDPQLMAARRQPVRPGAATAWRDDRHGSRS